MVYWKHINTNSINPELKSIEESGPESVTKRPRYNTLDQYSRLEEMDVICENAFLFAWHLPPRIDHQFSQESEAQEFHCYQKFVLYKKILKNKKNIKKQRKSS